MKLLCVLLITACVGLSAPASLRPTRLKCEYRTNPQGIDERNPRLTWLLTATSAGARALNQTAYQVVVASTARKALARSGDLWDSGKVDSGDSVLVAYKGKSLASGMQAFWRVRVWDEQGRPSGWSDTAQWSMGLLQPGDWKGKWIGLDETGVYHHPGSPFQMLKTARWIWLDEGDPVKEAPAGIRWFRSSVNVPADRIIRHATFVLGADDSFELTINGRYSGRGGSIDMPEVLDVAAWLKPGENAIEVQARKARAGSAGVIGTLRIEFAAGAPLSFSTGANWQASTAAGGPWNAARDLGEYGMKPWGEVGFSEEHALPARMLRKEFTVNAGLQRATVYYSGLGLSELYLNGAKAGDAVLSPGLTDYTKRVFYVSYDVTKQLAAGKNAIGVMLGNGRFWAPREHVPFQMQDYGYPKLRLQIELEYANSRHTSIVSDETWKLTTDGPVRVNNEYDGEEHDARMEMPSWSRAGFDDSKWQAASVVQAPPGVVAAQMAEPLRVMETLTPKSMNRIRPGVFVFDMGQNMVGWARLSVTGPKGTVVTLRFAETLRSDGTLYLDNLRSARATDVYTLKGGPTEVWEPRFTYHGFRYVEVTGYPGTPSLRTLSGRVVHDAIENAGEFESSNALLNRIYHNTYWGMRGNYRSIPTDCPQRDERQGWLGDRSVGSLSESYLFDVAAFYTKWATDLADSQRADGSIPDVAPNYWKMHNDGIVWPSTFLLVASMVYDQYGDARLIERYYPAMKKWVKYMSGFLKDGIMPKNSYGDWCTPPEKPELIHSMDPGRVTKGALISTAYYYKMLELMRRYAVLGGHDQDALEFQALAAKTREAFLKSYFKSAEGRFDNGTQTSSVLPLAFGMVPEQERTRAFENLVRKIEGESNNHIGVGLVGAQWLMRTLSDNGRTDLAYTIATQKTYPGWGYMVEKDATTVWELWNGDTADPAMNSGNHVMLIGDLALWMYEDLAGIRPDPDRPGFKHAIIRPLALPALTYVNAWHKSPYGVVKSSWKRADGRLSLLVTLPPNTTATIYVPGANAAETGGLKPLRSEGGATVFEAGSGSYAFTVQSALP
jgi:alpha-L-rhamnosidase